MLIDGELVEAASGKRFENINPATEEVLGEVADASAEDMQRAIDAARQAFDETDWSTNRALRKRCLEQLQAALEAEREAYREEIIAEVGHAAHDDLRGAGRLADRRGPRVAGEDDRRVRVGAGPPRRGNDGDAEPARRHRRSRWASSAPSCRGTTRSRSRSTSSGPILATGNTMILKPAPDTPWNATRLGRLIAEKTDIPPGVVNVVTSSDHLVGEELTLSPLVDLISFTGSTATGKRIMEKGAATLKRVFLELGGKSAMIVCDDADFASVGARRPPWSASTPARAAPCRRGCCCPARATTRASSSSAPACRGFPTATRRATPWSWARSSARKQRDRVLGYIAKGQEEGAKLVIGGGRPADQPKGWFVEPTLFVDVDNSMTIAQEEIFGPVLCVIPYEDDDDAVRIANESNYGLSGGVVSASEERATAIARRIRTGSIGVNGGLWYGADSPYGGYKDSGIGRQCGIEGLEQYLETKAIAWPG